MRAASELPVGTVTLLFSDVEGSTALARALGDAWLGVVADQRAILRDAAARHGGIELGTEGDGMRWVFGRARAAVAAAAEAQRALARHRWPDGCAVQVRMGLHTGEPELTADGYEGLDMHRVARVMAAGHGGQVLMTGAVRETLGERVPAGLGLRDLGRHALRDLPRPEHLFQLEIDGLPAWFPALRTGEPKGPRSTRHALRMRGFPVVRNRIIGRDREIVALAERLSTPAVRLLTLTGPGGVGKTRLAIEAASAAQAQFADGTVFVSLADSTQPDAIAEAIVDGLGIIVLGGEGSDDAARRYLAAKEMLVVADNFEHVLGGALLISRLLDACPDLTVLATSRVPLNLGAEERQPVAPLALPGDDVGDDPEALAAVDAVALFCERARARDPGFHLDAGNAPAVAKICERVDGLPLAIELAAARCDLLSPEEISERLDAALDVLGAGPLDAPARQRTLRATIEWSHGLLDEAERTCLARFAVFAGGASLDAALEVTGARLDTLESLVAKNLLVRVPGPPTRLAMLETIRAFTAERLEARPDADTVREAHGRLCLAFAEAHSTEQALWGERRAAHLAALDREAENLDEALRVAIATKHAELALSLVALLNEYWWLRHRFAHSMDRMEQALRLPEADSHPALRLRVLLAKIDCLWPVGRWVEAPALIEDAAAIAGNLGHGSLIARVAWWKGRQAIDDGDLDTARRLADEAIEAAAGAGDDWQLAIAHALKAEATPARAERRALTRQATARLRAAGNVLDIANLLGVQAYWALLDGEYRDAQEFIAQQEPIARLLDDAQAIIAIRGTAGFAAVLSGDIDLARRSFREHLELCRETVLLPQAHTGLLGCAALAAVDGERERAARLFGAAEAHRFGEPKNPLDVRIEEAFLNPARDALGAETWKTAAAAGAAFGHQAAIAYALRERETTHGGHARDHDRR